MARESITVAETAACHNGPVRVVLISTYDLGRQPFGLASPAAWLKEAGHDVVCVDTSRSPLTSAILEGVGAVGFHLPMHTATRLALPLIRKVRALAPAARIAAYGLYAPLTEPSLRAAGVDAVLGAESEPHLVAFVTTGQAGAHAENAVPDGGLLPRIAFRVPDRSTLPPVHRYVHLRLPNGARRVVGYTEASRGCKHWCRHCPVVPVYRGQFRIVPVDVVVADVAQQVEQGATHVTFGDADFLNGPRHAVAVAEALASRFSGLTYDVTIKVEHLVRHQDVLPQLARTGCALVTSAFEGFDDEVLARLKKGHTRADIDTAVSACAAAGLPLSPTFVAFTPWTTVESYGALLGHVARLGLVESVAPIQLALRLLVPQGSLMLEDEQLRQLAGPFDEVRLVHPWAHPDPAVDALQRDVEALVTAQASLPRRDVFANVVELAGFYASGPSVAVLDIPARASVPYLEEPWYC